MKSNKFSELFKDNLELTEDGKQFLKPLTDVLNQIFQIANTNGFNSTQKQILASKISNIVGTEVFKSVQDHIDLVRKLSNMSDDDFEIYLKTKYGDKWILITLLPEEFDRYTPIADAKGDKIIKNIVTISHFPPKRLFNRKK